MSSEKFQRPWKIYLTLTGLVVIILSIIIWIQLGKKGQVASAYLTVNSPVKILKPLTNLMNRPTLRYHILSQAKVQKEVSFFIVENLGTKNRLRLSLRFFSSAKDVSKEKVLKVIDAFNKMDVINAFYQEGLREAKEHLTISGESLEKNVANRFILTPEAAHQFSPTVAQARLNTYTKAQGLFTTNEILIRNGGRDIKLFLILVTALVILMGLGSMILHKITANE